MIDPSVEKLLSLTEATKALPKRREGKKPHVSCLYRWTTVGFKGVVLESVQVGSTRCTSVEALGRFFNQLTGGRGSKRRTVSQRERAIKAAERALNSK